MLGDEDDGGEDDGDEDDGGGGGDGGIGDGDDSDGDNGYGGDNDGSFPSFHTECAPRPLHLHLCAGAVPLRPGPAGDAGEHGGEVRRGKYLIHVLIYEAF